MYGIVANREVDDHTHTNQFLPIGERLAGRSPLALEGRRDAAASRGHNLTNFPVKNSGCLSGPVVLTTLGLFLRAKAELVSFPNCSYGCGGATGVSTSMSGCSLP
jgi:hypothetical protein